MSRTPANSIRPLKREERGVFARAAVFPFRRGFTLMEILLAIMILIFLYAAASMGLRAYRHNRALSNAAGTWESALKMAGTEASASGRKLMLNFTESDDEDGPVTVSLEYQPDPLDDPEETVQLQLRWLETLSDENLRILSAGPPPSPGGEETGREDSPLHPIAFYPDGSSDSARIIIAPVDEDDTRRLMVELIGETGRVAARMVDAEDLEEEQ